MADRPLSPTSFLDFIQRFSTVDACIEFLASSRWPDGFRCPRCRGSDAWQLRSRPLWECSGCGKQTSVTAGTVLHKTRTDLRIWLYALWVFGVRHTSISALQLQRETGLRRYETAWTILHKVRAVLSESPDYKLSRGVVEVDESSWGGGGRNKGRRLDPLASWLLVAVERIEMTKGIGEEAIHYQASGSARLVVAKDCSKDTLLEFIRASISPGATIATDGWGGYHRLVEAGFVHNPRKCGGLPAVTDEHLPKVHLLISNLKTWLRGTFHGVSDKHLLVYAREFIYRFNRRHLRDRQELFGYVVRRVVRNAPTTMRELIHGQLKEQPPPVATVG